MTDYGTEVSAIPDLSFSLRSGPRVVAEAVARRLVTPRGGLFYAVDYGMDVRELLNARVTEPLLFAWKASLEQECLRDDRVAAAVLDLTFDAATGSVSVSGELELQEGEAAGFALLIKPPTAAEEGGVVTSEPTVDFTLYY